MKTGFLRICSIVLVLVLLVNMLPMSIFAEEYREILAAAPEISMAEPNVDTSDAQIVEEIVDKRTQYSKEFLLSNGLHMATVYADAVHYEKDSGWAEIDNTLTAKADGTYTNTAGVWNVRFPQQLNENKSVVIEKDGYTLSFAMAGELRSSGELMTASMDTTGALEQFSVSRAQNATAAIQEIDKESIYATYQYAEAAPEKLYSRLQYTGVYQNTDVMYDLDSNRIKESIILNAYSSTLRGYRYTLNVGEMIPVLEEDGQITFYDSEKKNVIMVMPAPYLVDAAEESNWDVRVQLTGSNGVYTLTYLLPQQWLAAEDRTWPVILDPVVNANLAIKNIKDDTVSEKNEYDYEKEYLEVGHSNTRGISRIFLKYEKLPTLTSSDVIVGATITMQKKVDGETVPVEVHKVNDTWTSSTINWSNKPGYNQTIEDFAIVDAADKYTWVITDIARDWYANKNSGMMFKVSDAAEAAQDNRYKQFHSSDQNTASKRPTLTIYFRNNNGLESYWDYTASSAGRAGTGYVNNFTGNLVWLRDDIGFGGNRMPVSINHVYNLNDAIVPSDSNNSNDTGGNSFGMGIGWRTNFNQLVYRWKLDNVDKGYYIWEDPDGTDHYFAYNSEIGKYKDEDGLELTLTDTGSDTEKYCITDKNSNKSFFDTSGRLTKLQNNQNTKSSINITYKNATSKLITKITDGVGRVYSFVYVNDFLSEIQYLGSGDTVLSRVVFYYTSSCLTKVRHADGKDSNYTYTGALLQTAADVDGYMLTYSYNTIQDDNDWQPYRVKNVSESDGSALGGSLTFDYAHNQTTITDYNNNVEIHQFNDFGNTICIQDDEGHATYTQYAKNNYKDTTNKSNQLTLSSKMQNTVGNYLKDSSFESSNSWLPLGASAAVTRTNTQAHIGNYALKIDTTGQGLHGAHSETFYLEPGKTITFSAYVKADTSYLLQLQRKVDSNTYQNYYSETFEPHSTWIRRQLSYTNESDQTQQMWAFLLTSETGPLYMDCVQLELAETASRYNLINNGDFRSGEYGWTRGTYFESTESCVTKASAAPQLDNTAYRITGSTTYGKHLWQQIPVSGNAGDCYVLSGWAQADSVPLLESTGRQFALVAFFQNTDGTTTKRILQFNPDTNSEDGWQYLAGAVVADKAYHAINIDLQYDLNMNSAYFDGIQLYKEAFGSSYTYDDKGNVIKVVDLQGQETEYIFDEATKTNLEQIKQNGNAKMTYDYDNYHNVTKATTATGLVYNFTYDQWGNNTSVSITSGGSTMTSTATYSTDGNRLVSTTDALGNETRYNYLADTNVLEWVEYPRDTEFTQTYYSYDSMYRMTMAECETDMGNSLYANYTYTDDYLTRIYTPSTTYNFTYGDFGLRTGVSVGNRTLATYNYTEEAERGDEDDRKYDLDSLDYGNGDSVEYEYDKKGRVTYQEYENGDYVTYTYDNDGALAKVTDSATGITTTYYYDLTDRMMKYVESGSGYSHSVGYEYDTLNNLTQLVETINGVDHTTTYTYDDDNRVETVTTDGVTIEYAYDDFGRIETQITKNGSTEILTESYTYKAPTSATTSAQVATYTTTTPNGYSVTYSYEYDDNGNIISIFDGTDSASYVYDSANQLIRENNQAGNYTHTWTYTNAGNILSRKEYAYTTESLEGVTPTDTITYTYGDSQWGDLLTAYDGNTITYDGIGNMLSDGTWTYTWEHGRELASMSDGTTTWDYTYDANGMRTKKTNGTDTYTYVYNGGSLSQVTKGDDVLRILYDGEGQPMTVLYNNAVFFYLTNIQGDVIAILNASRTSVVEYTYDAWGNILSISGPLADTLGIHNPLRYRGYVYDTETGLYYVSSRYYDPEIGRWINADGVMSDVGGDICGYNLFAYCMNNPVNMSDPTGNWPSWATKLVAAVAVVAVVAAVAAITVATAGAGTAAAVIAVGAAKGAAIGLATGAAIGAGTAAVNHRVSTGSWEGADKAALEGAGDGALSGAITGAVTGAASGATKVAQAAKAWDSGTFKSGYQSMKYHYNKHVVSEGLTKGNNVLKYTQDAVSFANRNSSVLKYTYNYNYGNASWNLTYSTGQGGMFTSAGKILTFWYR